MITKLQRLPELTSFNIFLKLNGSYLDFWGNSLFHRRGQKLKTIFSMILRIMVPESGDTEGPYFIRTYCMAGIISRVVPEIPEPYSALKGDSLQLELYLEANWQPVELSNE